MAASGCCHAIVKTIASEPDGPGALRKRATCSMNSHYSAWYVGGGAGLPFLSNRHRTAEEGTWGLDYSLWKKPRTVWMKWTCGRHQGGEGAYETDHEPLF